MTESVFETARWVWHPSAELTPDGRVHRTAFFSFAHRLPAPLAEQLKEEGVPLMPEKDLAAALTRPVAGRFRRLREGRCVGLVFGSPGESGLAWWDGNYPVDWNQHGEVWTGEWIADITVRREGKKLRLEAPGVPGYFEWSDSRWGGKILELLGSPEVKVGEDQSKLSVVLAGAGFIVPPTEGRRPLIGSAHDRLFHWKWRLNAHGEPRGALFPGRTAGKPPPSPYPEEDALPGMIPLPCPREEEAVAYSQVVANRKSTRTHGERGLTLTELGKLFAWGIGQQPASPESGAAEEKKEMRFLHRSYPSSGGVHEIDVFLHLRQEGELAPGFYYYNPRRHGLTPIEQTPAQLERIVKFGEGASQFSGPVTAQLLLVARMDRLHYKYEGMGYALALQDCGACITSLYFAAAAAGLAICAIGNGDERFLQNCPVLTGQSRLWLGHLLLGAAPDHP